MKWAWFLFPFLFGGSFAFSDAAKSAPASANGFTFLQNDHIKIGIKKGSGAAIGWFSKSQSKTNIINHYDHGRLIQQSYYGKVDGSKWVEKPWRWNPVQGGDYQGKASKVLAINVTKDKIYAKTQPRHWATGDLIKTVAMEQWITLDGNVAHVRFRMTYSGKEKHPPQHQELPAVFVDRKFGTLQIYDGKKPWTNDKLQSLSPGQRNEYHAITEPWGAFVDEHDFGIGVLVPIAKQITTYRVAKPGEKGACSYVAPIATFAIQPRTVFEYDVFLTLGKTAEIRSRFQRITKALESKRD